MQCSPQRLHSKPVMHKQFDTRQHVRTAGAWRGLDRQALEGCLGVVALALGVVMAGTGHLPTLKLLRGGSPFLVTSSLTLLAPITPPPPAKLQTAFPFFGTLWHYPLPCSAVLLPTCSCFQFLLNPIFLHVMSHVCETCVVCCGFHALTLQWNPIHLHRIS